MKRTVVIGLLGLNLDAGGGPDRWQRWRPTVSLCQQDDLVVDRLELLHDGSRNVRRTLKTVVADIATASPATEVRDHEIPFSDPWDFQEVFGALHGFARGYAFDPEAEDYLVHITTGTHVAQICLFLLTESRHLPARLLQTAPPRGRGRDAIGSTAVIDLDLSRYDELARRFALESAAETDVLKSGIETRNDAFNRAIERIHTVSLASRDPILLLGPTGAGKSQLARSIFALRAQRHQLEGRLVEVNCATLRGDAAMSALFGHRRGAFTGADRDRPGLLRAAEGGMLFLDEIGELGLDEQAMLLRALEEKRFLPVGSDTEVEVDFQLIAGTNRDLRREVAAGAFREDLLARIDLWTFRLPGLRERLDDLEPNLAYELELFLRRSGRRVSFNAEARRRYLAFATSAEAAWRGNFRDLNASVTRMATLAPGGRIDVPTVDEELLRLRALWSTREPAAAAPAGAAEARLRALLGDERVDDLDRFDRVQLTDVVTACLAAPNLSAAGRELFAASRRRKSSSNDADRLRKYLARFDLAFKALKG